MARKIKDIAEEVKDLQGKVLSPSQLKRLEHEVHRAMVSSAEDIALRRMALNNINMLKMAYLQRLMPTIDIIDGKGVEYIPFAKSKLFDLKRLMTLTGQDFMYKNYRIGDTGIFVRSGRDSIGDLIRIRQKGGEDAYIFLIGFASFEAKYLAALKLEIVNGKFRLVKSNRDLSDYVKQVYRVKVPLLCVITNPSMNEHVFSISSLDWSPFYGSDLKDFESTYDYGYFWYYGGYPHGYPATGDYLPVGKKIRFKDSFTDLCYDKLVYDVLLSLYPNISLYCSPPNIVVGMPDKDDPVKWGYCRCVSLICAARMFNINLSDSIKIIRNRLSGGLITQKHSVVTTNDDIVDKLYVYGTLSDFLTGKYLLFYYNNDGCHTEEFYAPLNEHKITGSIKRYDSDDKYISDGDCTTVTRKLVDSHLTPEKGYSAVLGLLGDKFIYLKKEKSTSINQTINLCQSGTFTEVRDMYYVNFAGVECLAGTITYTLSLNVVDSEVSVQEEQVTKLYVGDILIDTIAGHKSSVTHVPDISGWTSCSHFAEGDYNCVYYTYPADIRFRIRSISGTFNDVTLEGYSFSEYKSFALRDYDYLTSEDTFILIYRIDTSIDNNPTVAYTYELSRWNSGKGLHWLFNNIPTIPTSEPKATMETGSSWEYRIAYCIKGTVYPIIKIPEEYGTLYAISTHACKDNLLYTFLSYSDRRRVIGIINLRDDIKDMDVGYRQEFEINDDNWKEFFEEETDPEIIKLLDKYYPERKWFSKFPWKAPNAIGYHKGGK